MLTSIVIFTFGLIISFIVALGLINANELQVRQKQKNSSSTSQTQVHRD